MDESKANELYMKFVDYLDFRPTEDDYDIDEFLMEESDPLVEDAPEEARKALDEYMEYLIPYMEEKREQRKKGIVVID